MAAPLLDMVDIAGNTIAQHIDGVADTEANEGPFPVPSLPRVELRSVIHRFLDP